MKKLESIFLGVVACFLVVTMASQADAKPSFGVNCSDCHTGDAAMQLDLTLPETDLGTDLAGNTRGPLPTYTVDPGETGASVILSMDVLDGANVYAVELKRLDTGGVLNSQGNFLVFTDESDPSRTPQIDPDDGVTPYFTEDDGDDGFTWQDETVTHTFDLFVDASTPPDMYDLVFAVATSGGGRRYADAHFYLNVVLACDFDADGNCDIADLNAMLAIGPVAPGVPAVGNEGFDLTGDGVIDNDDVSEWLEIAGSENGFASPYKVGDANLDGTVDGQDFLLWNGSKFTSSLLWDSGDFNGDGVVDGQDFLLWNGNKFTSSDGVSAVPEPGAGLLTFLGLSLLGLTKTPR